PSIHNTTVPAPSTFIAMEPEYAIVDGHLPSWNTFLYQPPTHPCVVVPRSMKIHPHPFLCGGRRREGCCMDVVERWMKGGWNLVVSLRCEPAVQVQTKRIVCTTENPHNTDIQTLKTTGIQPTK